MAKIFDEEVLSVNSSTSVRLTSTNYDHVGSTRANQAIIQVGSTPIYFSFGDAEPSATNGYIGNVGDVVRITNFDNIRDVKIISQSGSGSVFVSYE